MKKQSYLYFCSPIQLKELISTHFINMSIKMKNRTKLNGILRILAGIALVILIVNLPIAFSALSQSITIQNSGSISLQSVSSLHTSGMYIEDSSGKIVTLRGVDKGLFCVDSTGGFGGIGVWSQSAMQADVDRMAGYHFTCIRVILAMDYLSDGVTITNKANTWNGANTANRGTVDCLKDYISYCGTKGIYVLLAPWEIVGPNSAGGGGQSGGGNGNPPWGVAPISTVATCANWYKLVATTFQSYPNVLYELGNEVTDSPSYQSGCVQIVQAIRSITQAPIVVQTGYAGGFSWAASYMNALQSYGNIILSNHIYGVSSTFNPTSSYTTKALVADHLLNYWNYKAVIGKYPVIIGELGYYIGTDSSTWHQSLLSQLNDWGVSYTAWIWDQNYGGAYGLLNSQGGSLTVGGQNLVNAIASG